MAKSIKRRKSRRVPRKSRRVSPRKSRRVSRISVKPRGAIPRGQLRLKYLKQTKIARDSIDWFREMYPKMKLSSDVRAYIIQVNIDAKDLLDVAQGIAYHRDGRNVIELDDLMEAKKRDVYLNSVFPDRPMTRGIPVEHFDEFERGIHKFSEMYPRAVMTEDAYSYLKKLNSSYTDTLNLLLKAEGVAKGNYGTKLIDVPELMEAKKKV